MGKRVRFEVEEEIIPLNRNAEQADDVPRSPPEIIDLGQFNLHLAFRWTSDSKCQDSDSEDDVCSWGPPSRSSRSMDVDHEDDAFAWGSPPRSVEENLSDTSNEGESESQLTL